VPYQLRTTDLHNVPILYVRTGIP